MNELRSAGRSGTLKDAIRKKLASIEPGFSYGLNEEMKREAFPGEVYGAMDRLALALSHNREAQNKTPREQAREFAEANGLSFFSDGLDRFVFHRPSQAPRP